MRYEMLTPGQKIRKLRKKLGATQQEVVGSEYSRNTLTMIETHKQNLTYETAKVIADNLNEIARKKKVKIEPVTADYLMESFDVQCDKIAEKYIKELDDMKVINDSNRFTELKAEVVDFLQRYENYIFAQRRFMLNYLIGENLLRLFMYDEAYIYSYKSYDIVMSLNDSEKRLQVMALMIGICYRLNRITEILAIGSHAMDLAQRNNINDSSALEKVYYNLALAYKKTGKYTECCQLIEKLLRLPSLKKEIAISARILKANCFTENKDYISAEKMYNETLDEAKSINDVNAVAIIYWNLADINLKRNRKDEAEYYADHLVYMDCNSDMQQTANNMYWAAYVYKETDNYEALGRYLGRALSLLHKVKNHEGYYDLVSEVLNYYIDKGKSNDVVVLLNKMLDDMTDGTIKDNYKSMLVGKVYKGLFVLDSSKSSAEAQDIFKKVSEIDK